MSLALLLLAQVVTLDVPDPTVQGRLALRLLDEGYEVAAAREASPDRLHLQQIDRGFELTWRGRTEIVRARTPAVSEVAAIQRVVIRLKGVAPEQGPIPGRVRLAWPPAVSAQTRAAWAHRLLARHHVLTLDAKGAGEGLCLEDRQHARPGPAEAPCARPPGGGEAPGGAPGGPPETVPPTAPKTVPEPETVPPTAPAPATVPPTVPETVPPTVPAPATVPPTVPAPATVPPTVPETVPPTVPKPDPATVPPPVPAPATVPPTVPAPAPVPPPVAAARPAEGPAPPSPPSSVPATTPPQPRPDHRLVLHGAAGLTVRSGGLDPSLALDGTVWRTWFGARVGALAHLASADPLTVLEVVVSAGPTARWSPHPDWQLVGGLLAGARLHRWQLDGDGGLRADFAVDLPVSLYWWPFDRVFVGLTARPALDARSRQHTQDGEVLWRRGILRFTGLLSVGLGLL